MTSFTTRTVHAVHVPNPGVCVCACACACVYVCGQRHSEDISVRAYVQLQLLPLSAACWYSRTTHTRLTRCCLN